MTPSLLKTLWNDWSKFRRLIPLVTALAAVVTGILSLLRVLQPTFAEGIIITLLGLLAVDSLVERIGLLEKIEERVSHLPSADQLRDRDELTKINEEMGMSASEINAAGPTLHYLITSNYDFFAKKMREGCNLKFILLDPRSPAWDVWHQGQRTPTHRSDIAGSIKTLCELMDLESRGVAGKCEVKLSQTYLNFSLVMTDPEKEGGRMNVEMLPLKISIHSRPHVHLTKRAHKKWFDLFYEQFTQHWDNPLNKTFTANDEEVVLKCVKIIHRPRTRSSK